MGIEIERKYLVKGESWRGATTRSFVLDQGYIRSPDATVRVRTIDDAGYVTIKGRTVGVTRTEYEYSVPFEDAKEMLDQFCGERRLTKTRHMVDVGGHEWSIDEFSGRHEGLIIAEIELTSEDEAFEMPDWAAEEVSGDPRYYNSNLVSAPATDG